MTISIDWHSEGIAAYNQAMPEQRKNWLPYVRAVYADLLRATGQRRSVTSYRIFARAFMEKRS